MSRAARADNTKRDGRPQARDVGAGEDIENLSSELVRFVSLWARRRAKRGTDKLRTVLRCAEQRASLRSSDSL